LKNIRIMTVCGFGLGTSLILKMTLDDVLARHHHNVDTFCSDADTALGQQFDLVLTSVEMSEMFSEVDVPVVVIQNFLSVDEVEEKVLPTLQAIIGE